MAKATSSNASSSPPGSSRWQGFLIFGVFALGGLLFIGLAGFGWLASNANVFGIAMSPETFEFRRFHYYVNPFSGERMWGIN